MRNFFIKITPPMSFIICFFFTTISIAQITHYVSFETTSKNYITTEAKDNNNYTKLEYQGLTNTYIVGAPSLPVKYVKLLIPAQQDVDKITFEYNIAAKKKLSNKIYPSQPAKPSIIGFEDNVFISPDPSIYESDNPWPEKIVELVHSGYLDNNNHIITLKVVPFQYYPKIDRLEELDGVKIDLVLKGNSHQIVLPKMRTFKTQEIWDSAIEYLVENNKDISKYQNKPQLVEKFESLNDELKKPGPVRFYEYTVITTNALKNYFNTLINHKRSKGLNAGIITVETIYSNYTGDLWSGIIDNAGKIRSYLRDVYEVGGAWVLLGGDHDKVPVRHGCGWKNDTWTFTRPNDYKIPTDLYFADRNGDWQVDGDIYYGQPNITTSDGDPGDNPDYYPDLFVGRLLCKSGSEITRWTQKLIKYENNPGNGDTDYLLDCLMIEADELQDANQANQTINHLPSFTTNTIREYPSGSSTIPTAPTAQYVLSVMNDAPYYPGFQVWLCHGDPTSLVVRSRGAYVDNFYCLDAEDAYDYNHSGQPQIPENLDALDNLTNTDYPSIIYSASCINVPFDDYDIYNLQYYYNLGESFTIKTTAGGPAFLGNTRYGWIDYSYLVFIKFADLIENGNRHLGVAELISKANYNGAESHFINFSHNLVGCPETEIYTSIPLPKESDRKNFVDNKIQHKKYKLIGNYPNPFNPSTKIRFSLQYQSNVQLIIYDILGKEVKNITLFNQPTGNSEIIWDGKGHNGKTVPSGTYIYRIIASSIENDKIFTSSAKMVFLK